MISLVYHDLIVKMLWINIEIVCFRMLINLVTVDSITPVNPCDPMQSNISVSNVLKSSMFETMMEFDIVPMWFYQPMNYINCSRRGLEKIPNKIHSVVQILDLSSNVLSQIRKEDFKRFGNLEVLWLYSNCIGDLPEKHFYCTAAAAGVYENNVFSSLTKLKVLNIGGNSFERLPTDIPVSLEFLDVSRTGIKKIIANDLCYLTNLLMFDATNLCFTGKCEVPLNIDNHTFENLPIKILQLGENWNIFHLLSFFSLSSLIYINFAQMYGTILGPDNLNDVTSIKGLDMHLLNPNAKTKLKVLNNTFDKLLVLEHLDLSSNMIEILPNNIFLHNLHLTYLDLSGNCLFLTVIDPAYVPEQMQYLYLGFNYCRPDPNKENNRRNHSRIIRSAYHAFGPSFLKMKNLTVLSYAKPGKLGTATQISTQISFQDLTRDTLYNLRQMQQLSKLIIRDSFIQNIDLSIISCFSTLSYLDLYDNIIGNITVSNQPCFTEQRLTI